MRMSMSSGGAGGGGGGSAVSIKSIGGSGGGGSVGGSVGGASGGSGGGLSLQSSQGSGADGSPASADDVDRGDGEDFFDYSHDESSMDDIYRHQDSFNDLDVYLDDDDRRHRRDRVRHRMNERQEERRNRTQGTKNNNNFSKFFDDTWDSFEDVSSSSSSTSSPNTITHTEWVIILERSKSMGPYWGEALAALRELVYRMQSQYKPQVNLVTYNHLVNEFVITPDQEIENVLSRYGPNGSANLASAISSAFNIHSHDKHVGTRMLIITHGVPDSANKVKDQILQIVRKSKGRVSFTFFQIGNFEGGTQFLYRLAESLERAGLRHHVDIYPSNVLTQPFHQYFT